jgi:sterol desaturase/sphingolipid hydroxylase (fatty acid hydroxylase superfamily)
MPNLAVHPLLPILLTALLMMLAEGRSPGRRWDAVPGWWGRVFTLTAIQALLLWLTGHALEAWLQEHRLIEGAQRFGILGGAALGYLATTFANYWWHRARHEVPLLWRLLHQIHHSPARIEVATSFYKHPLEIAANAVFGATLLLLVLGLAPESAAITITICGVMELFYHWNVRTPRWLGYIVQRPESHCIHHERGVHNCNYADLPIWDILFGTFHNPETFDRECGFDHDRECRLVEMLTFKDVNTEPIPARPSLSPMAAAGALVAIGTVQMVGDLSGSPTVRGLGMAANASPAPKVFTAHEGLETYSAQFFIHWTDIGGASHVKQLTPRVNRGLRGPYNRRNAFGAMIAGGPMLNASAATRAMHAAALSYTRCGAGGALDELGIDRRTIAGPVTIELRLRTPPKGDRNWRLAFDAAC